jgi:hypothetical protein
VNVVFEDVAGRKTARQVPDGAPHETWRFGNIIGPPDLTPLGLPEEVLTRLNNELFARGIIRAGDARRNRAEIHAALQAALRVDAERIVQVFEENANG